MERLTDRTEDGLICLNNNGNCGFIEQLIKAMEKLAQFEDFMEGNKFESIENLQNAINGKFQNIFDETHKVWIKVVEDKNYAEKMNRILKDRWEKLKEWVENKMEVCPNEEWYDFEEMFCEMQELELTDLVREKEK